MKLINVGKFVALIFLIFSSIIIYNYFNHENDLSGQNRLPNPYIPGMHKMEKLYIADSLYLRGDYKWASRNFIEAFDSCENKSYILTRLAEIDYFQFLIVGEKSNEKVIDQLENLVKLREDNYFTSIYEFYKRGILNPKDFKNQITEFSKQNGIGHYWELKGYFILGEYYKSIQFDLDSSLFYFIKFRNSNIEYQNNKHIDLFWTYLRLAELYLYKRDNLSSMFFINDLSDTSKCLYNGNKVYLLYTMVNRANLLYRFENVTESERYLAIVLKEINSGEYKYLYQNAVKNLLNIGIYYNNDSLYYKYLNELHIHISKYNYDYININRYIGRYFFERGKHDSSIYYNDLALSYALGVKNLDIPGLSTIAYVYSKSLEELKQFEKSVQVYLTGESKVLNAEIDLQSLTAPLKLQSNYYYVTLTRIASIYYSWYLESRDYKKLEFSNKLATLADHLAIKYLNELNEEKLIAFLKEYKLIMDLLARLNAKLYFESGDESYLYDYMNFIEKGKLIVKNNRLYYLNNKIDYKREFFELSKNIKADRLFVLNSLKNGFTNNMYPLDSLSGFDTNLIKLDLNLLHRKLKTEKAVIYSISFIDNEIYLFLIGPKRCELKLLKNKKEFIENVNNYLEIIKNGTNIGGGRYASISHEIYISLFTWDEMLTNSDKIYIVQDEFLKSINYETLSVDGYVKDNKFENINYLVNQKMIIYSNSIANLSNKELASGLIKNISVFAWSSHETVKRNNSQLMELPGSVREIEEIKKNISNVTAKSGFEATKSNFYKVLRLQSNDLFHISMHARSSTTLKDEIILYFRNKSKLDSVYGYEILGEKLYFEYLILLSCEGAMGKNDISDGVISLSNYFLQNGVKYVVSSTDKISDHVSYLFSKEFYSLLAHNNFLYSYWNAKTNLIKNGNVSFADWSQIIIIA